VTAATLFLDLGSPYAYLAAERVHTVLAGPVEFQPVLLGAMFKQRGWGSWADTEHRALGMAEVQARAERYGLPPIVWPRAWPASALGADRAAAWAKQHGLAEPFVLALYRQEFRRGADITRPEVLEAAAAEAGLDPGAVSDAIKQPEVKEALRQATDEAWEIGVRGVPTLRLGDVLLYGDDRLSEAAALAAGS
jgi:2-hydroxychromene-2-carboxylate isomerase